MPFNRLHRTLTGVALPPAFLAPRLDAQRFSILSPRSALAPSSNSTSRNSAHNLRGTLRRLGKGTKWTSQAPTKPTVLEHEAASTSRSSPRRPLSAQRRPSASSSEARSRHIGFRLRAKKLLDHLNNAGREIDSQLQLSRTTPAQIDADVNSALAHFESEMKALRVMLKSKDVLVDPENAWKSASRIKAPCNAAIRICTQNGRYERALRVLNQMKKDGIFPSASTYNVVITGLTRSLINLKNARRSDSNPEALLETKEAQRVREVYEDLEKLWKQAHPHYFRRGIADTRLQSRAFSTLEKDNFHALTEQARRNLVSQQASVIEARDFPKVLTNAIGAYANFLCLFGSKEELTKLFEQLFPSTTIDSLAKGLGPEASPQDKLELAKGMLSDSLPIGDVTTFATFLGAIKISQESERLPLIERIWNRFATLMDLERHERASSQMASMQHRKSKASSAKGDQDGAVGDVAIDQPRFVPDERFLTELFNRLQPPFDADPTPQLRLVLAILSKVYALDLETSADGIVRDPQSSEYVEALGHQSYISADADDINGLGGPVTELRDSTVASCVFRVLSRPQAWKQCVALFNYLWARAHAEHKNAALPEDAFGRNPYATSVFGSTLRAPSVLNILWILAEVGDPVGARVVLDAMKRAAKSLSDGRHPLQGDTNRRTRRSRNAANQADQDEVHGWKPADLCYVRVMRANLAGILNGPDGLTAALERDSGTVDPNKRTFDAWAEAKSLVSEWYDQKDASSSDNKQTSSRWGADELKSNDYKAFPLRREGTARSDRLDKLTRIHADTMWSLFLHLARVHAIQEGDKGAVVAREALSVIDKRVGLETLVSESTSLLDEETTAPRADTGGEVMAFAHKVRSLKHLSRVIDLALDTSDHTFAPKADVELWKRVKKLLPAPSPSDKSESKTVAQAGRFASITGSVGSRSSAGNRLLLSRDDYLELEAEETAEADDKEAEGGSKTEQTPRGSYRMQRRSRHVEQELERWVRGASL